MRGFDVRISVMFLLLTFVASVVTGFVTKDMAYVHAAYTMLIVAAALAMGYVTRRE